MHLRTGNCVLLKSITISLLFSTLSSFRFGRIDGRLSSVKFVVDKIYELSSGSSEGNVSSFNGQSTKLQNNLTKREFIKLWKTDFRYVYCSKHFILG